MLSPGWGLCMASRIFLGGASGGSDGEASACNAGDLGLFPGSGRFPGEGIHPEEGIGYPLQCSWTFLVVQPVKNLPAMQETWV